MEALLANPDLLASLESIEMFRNITNDLTAMISTNKELRQKTLAKAKLNPDEKARKDDAAKKRENLKKRLQRFITRIPAFMYLTDDREKTIKDVITQVEPELFESVTGLTLTDFEQLVDARVFNDAKMNDAVWKFRTFEEPSLHYGEDESTVRTLGGWSLRRDERLARMIEADVLRPGDILTGVNMSIEVSATITDDCGVSVNGLRYESPDAAAEAATDGIVKDGWGFWQASTTYGAGSLSDLLDLVDEI